MRTKIRAAICAAMMFSLLAAEQGARYLIVAPGDFVQAAIPLAVWKTSKGMLAKVVSTAVTGYDTAQIHSYIQNAYNTWPIRPEYVMLLGAPTYIPSLSGNNDCYYGDVVGDYKMDIPVGRFPALSVRDCSTFTAKVLAYENPPVTGDTAWYLKGTTVIREDVPPDSYYQSDSRLLRSCWTAHGYLQAESLSDFQGHSSSNVTAAANSGRAFITYRGAGVTTWYTPFNAIYPYTWTNGRKLPVVVAATCATVTLYPGETMYGDQFIRAGTPDSLAGAVAYFGTTRTGSHVSQFRSACYRGFFHALYEEGVYRLGQATLRGRFWVDSLYANQGRYLEWNLLGDPELNVWTDKPRRSVVEYDSAILMAEQVFKVTVRVGGAPYRGAQVCVSMDSVIYAWATTDSAGEVGFTIDPTHPGTMTVTVTGNNLRPFFGTCGVILRDVGCTTVTAPAGTVDSGRTIEPACRVYNYGNRNEAYKVKMRIGTAYRDSVTVASHAPGAYQSVTFREWTPAVRGQYSVVCSTALATDQQSGNNRVAGGVFVRVSDVAALSITAPAGRYSCQTAVSPTASWLNQGNAAATFRAYVLMEDPAGTRLYSKYVNVVGLAAGADTCLGGFPPCTLSVAGTWTVRCSTYYPSDAQPGNNSLVRTFAVGPSGPAGWQEMTPMPSTPSGSVVKDGGWLAYNSGDRFIYAAKGNKTGDFHRYNANGSWSVLPLIPDGTEAKKPGKGATGAADGNAAVYATKGGNTAGFHKYDIPAGSWTQLPDVPLGPANKKVKGGTDMVCVAVHDTGYVYLLKGYKSEFYRYSAAAGAWQTLPDAPPGANPKWDKGSWLVYDGGHLLYAFKAKYHELYAYDLNTGSWGPALQSMPSASYLGTSKKSKDGGSGAWLNGGIYALKGGNTQEFWEYIVSGNSWTELETIPAYGSALKKKKVKAGGDIAAHGDGSLFALKGNKCNEFWRYVPGAFAGNSPRSASRDGVQTDGQTAGGSGQFRILPNPLRAGSAAVVVGVASRPGTARLGIYDPAGRCVRYASGLVRGSTFVLDLQPLSAGVYLARLDIGGFTATQKLVVGH